VAAPTALNVAMLSALAGIGMRMAEMMGERAEQAGYRAHEEAVVLEIVSRNVRRTIALSERLYEDSKKTPELLAAERAARAAAAERARLRETKETERPSPEALQKRESGPSDRENLLSDRHERLLHPDTDLALLSTDVSAVVLRVLQDAGVAPKREIWSDALMAHEISATHAQMQAADDASAAGRAAAAQGVDWREGVEFSKPPDVETKIGRFTFAPGGLLVSEEPLERPEAEWPPDILGGRPLPDLLRRRKPPDTG
jgi:hypothetical protein